MKSLVLDTSESPEGVPSRLSLSDCLDEFAVPERTINFEESLITTPNGVTRRLQMLNGNSKTDMLGYSLSDVPNDFVATVDDHRIRAPRPEQTQVLKDEIRKVEHLFASLRTIPESELQNMRSEEPIRLECLVPQGKEELISITPETTLDATLKKRILIMGNYPIPNADVSSMHLNPTEEVISDEDYFTVMELSETVISSLNADEVYIRRSLHIRELKVVSSLIYSGYTKVKWLPKRLYGLLSNGPSTHALLKDRNNLLHISSNYEGKVTLLHICKECSKWRLYGYCVINLNEYEVREVKVLKFPTVGKHNDTWLREQLQAHSCSNRDFFNTWIAPEPEVAIVKVIDKDTKQISVSKCPTNTWAPPIDSKGRQL